MRVKLGRCKSLVLPVAVHEEEVVDMLRDLVEKDLLRFP